MSGIRPVSGSATTGFGQTAYPSTAAAASTGGSGAGTGRDDQRSRAHWQQALQELEADALAAEQTLARGRTEEIAAWGRRSGDWVPPSGLGPIPDDLRERAMHLLQHQLAVAEALVERITQSQKQRDVAARMSYAPPRPVASYIDRAV